MIELTDDEIDNVVFCLDKFIEDEKKCALLVNSESFYGFFENSLTEFMDDVDDILNDYEFEPIVIEYKGETLIEYLHEGDSYWIKLFVKVEKNK